MRIYLTLLIIYIVTSSHTTTFAQSSEKLLLERKALLEQLEEAEAQTSSILGKKSKKDLRNTKEILNDIIEKDSEIIATLQREVSRKPAVVQPAADVVETEEKIIELENQLATLNNLANQRNIKTAELEQEVSTVKDRMFKYQSTILITFAIIFLLAIYISRLRKQSKLKSQSN